MTHLVPAWVLGERSAHPFDRPSIRVFALALKGEKAELLATEKDYVPGLVCLSTRLASPGCASTPSGDRYAIKCLQLVLFCLEKVSQ